jgi:hypothetical protein
MKYLVMIMLATSLYAADDWTTKELKSSAKRYAADVKDAQKRYARKLDSIKLWAMKKGDLETAQAVARLIKGLGGAKATSTVNPADLPKGAWWMILDYPNGKRGNHTITFGTKIIVDGRTITPLKNKKGLFFVDKEANWAQLWVKTQQGYEIKHWAPAEMYNKTDTPTMTGKARSKVRRPHR